MSNNFILKITPKFILSLVDKVQVLKYKKSSRNSVTNRIKKSTENNNYYHCHTVIFSSLLHVVLAGQPAEARGQRPTSTCGIITHGINTMFCRSLKSFIHFHNKQLKHRQKGKTSPAPIGAIWAGDKFWLKGGGVHLIKDSKLAGRIPRCTCGHAPPLTFLQLYMFFKKKNNWKKKKNVLMPRSVLLQISIVSLLRREAKSPVRSRGLAAQFFKKSYLNFLFFTFP